MIQIRYKTLLLLVVLGAGCFAYFKMDGLVKSRGYSNLPTFTYHTFRNFLQGEAADLNVELSIKQKHFAQLEQVRADALERGVIIQPEEPYVPCEIEFNGEKIKGEIRLKGKMTDHVSGNKWSFRIKTKKNDAFMGMQRFTLQHPGTRGYVYEWLHHQMCKQEGIMALRYEFINLSLNGEDLGVYAVEENFGQPLVQNNQRPKGPVFRFNPSLYWQARLNAMEGTYIAQEFTNFQNAHVEAFSKKETFTDSSLKASFVAANILMNKVRWGQVSIEEAFDVKKLAMRYALLDLCGGYHSVDWSDVKFYYNPILKKIEPVAYESFGPRKIDHIIGNYRFTENQGEFPSDYHDIIFSDSTFFAEYIQALRRVSAPGYLEQAIAPLQEALDKRIAIQYSEFPYKNFSLEVFRHNLTTIRKTLDAPKNFHAYLASRSVDSVTFQLQVIESLPTEVLGLRNKDTEVLLETPVLLPALQKDHRPLFKTLIIPVDSTLEVDTERAKGLELVYRVLGDSVERVCEVFPYSIHKYDDHKRASKGPEVFTAQQDFITIDSVAQCYYINRAHVQLDKAFLVPAGWTLKATAPLRLELKEKGSLQVEGKLQFRGIAEDPIHIEVNSSAPYWLSVMPGGGPSEWQRIACSVNTKSAVLVYGTGFKLIDLEMRGKSPTHIEAFNADLNLKRCVFSLATKSALELAFCKTVASELSFIACDKGIDSKAGSLHLSKSNFREVEKGMEIKREDNVVLEEVSMEAVGLGIEVQDGAQLQWTKGRVSQAKTVFKVHRKGNRYPPAQANCSGVEVENVEDLYELEADNRLILEGEQQKPNKK